MLITFTSFFSSLARALRLTISAFDDQTIMKVSVISDAIGVPYSK